MGQANFFAVVGSGIRRHRNSSSNAFLSLNKNYNLSKFCPNHTKKWIFHSKSWICLIIKLSLKTSDPETPQRKFEVYYSETVSAFFPSSSRTAPLPGILTSNNRVVRKGVFVTVVWHCVFSPPQISYQSTSQHFPWRAIFLLRWISFCWRQVRGTKLEIIIIIIMVVIFIMILLMLIIRI